MTNVGMIIEATSADLFYAGLVRNETSGPVKVETGTIILVNGYKRSAQWFVGSLTGKRLLQYRTPAGNWRNPLPSEPGTFLPDRA